MTSQINGLNQAVRNANDAISMVQTADGALIEVTNILQRMRELAIQASSETNSSTDRSALNTEFEALREEITRIAVNTQFNGAAVFGQAANSTKAFHVGANASQTISVVFGNFNAGATDGTAGLSGNTASTANSKFLALDEDGGSTTDDIVDQDLLSTSNATDATFIMDAAITAVNTERASYGAAINRLEYAADNLANVSQNASASRSRVLDADYASETTELARTQIIQQAATAMLSQANQYPQTVLALLN